MDPDARSAAMRAVNPAFIPRNHLVEAALDAAVSAPGFRAVRATAGSPVAPVRGQAGLRALRRAARSGGARATDLLRHLISGAEAPRAVARCVGQTSRSRRLAMPLHAVRNAFGAWNGRRCWSDVGGGDGDAGVGHLYGQRSAAGGATTRQERWFDHRWRTASRCLPPTRKRFRTRDWPRDGKLPRCRGTMRRRCGMARASPMAAVRSHRGLWCARIRSAAKHR